MLKFAVGNYLLLSKTPAYFVTTYVHRPFFQRPDTLCSWFCRKNIDCCGPKCHVIYNTALS